MAAHRYWRVRSLSTNGDSIVAVAEIEFRTTVGGTTATTGGTAISSAIYGGGYEAANAFDANNSTDWAANNATGWIGYRFAAAVNIVEVGCRARADYPASAPAVAQVEWSDDGTTWTREWTASFGAFTGGQLKLTVPPPPLAAGQHRAWRLKYDSSPRGYGSLAEVELRSTAGGVDQTIGAAGNAIQGTYYDDSYIGASAFDKDINSFWSSAAYEDWVGWDFGSGDGRNITEIAFIPRNDIYADQDAPNAGGLEWSDDLTTWTRVWSFAKPGTYSVGTTYVFTQPAPPPLLATVQRGVVIGGASPTVVLGATPTQGNTLIALGSHYNDNPSAQAGWTMLFSDNGYTNDGTMIAYKVAWASESASQTPFTTGAGGQSLAVVEVTGSRTPVVLDHFNDNRGATLALAVAARPGETGLLVGEFAQNQSTADFTIAGATVLATTTGTTNNNRPRRIKSFSEPYDSAAKSVVATLGAGHWSTGTMVLVPGKLPPPLTAAVGAAAGTSTATAVSGAVGSVGASAGTSSAAAGGSQLITRGGVGASAGTGTGVGAGDQATAPSVKGTAAGTSSATGVGAKIGVNAAIGQSTALGTALGVYASTPSMVGTAAGTSTAQASASALGTIEAVGSAAGQGLAGSGSFATGIIAVVGTATATGTATGVGTGRLGSMGTAAGTAAATAVGSYAPTPARGISTGTSSADAPALALKDTVGTAAATSLVLARAAVVLEGIGAATGQGSTNGLSDIDRVMDGAAAATSSAAAVGTGIGTGVGTSEATSDAAAASTGLALGQGSSIGTSTAAAAATGLAPTVGTAAGSSSAQTVTSPLAEGTGISSGNSTAVGVIVGFSDLAGQAAGTSAADAVGAAQGIGRGGSTAISLATAYGVRVGDYVQSEYIVTVDPDAFVVVVDALDPSAFVVVVAPEDNVVIVDPDDQAVAA